jgi:hypothetical protein
MSLQDTSIKSILFALLANPGIVITKKAAAVATLYTAHHITRTSNPMPFTHCAIL